jgi:phosphoribosylformylglycinamidine (FGAM) synthase PurS component
VRVQVLVRRKIADLVRDAAEGALRPACPALEKLDRAELWTFDVDGQDVAAVRGVLEGTTLVANPNVHRWAFQDAAGATPAPRAGCARIVLAVHDRVDAKGSAVLRALRERRGIRSVTSVRRGVLWTIDVALDRAAASALARELAGAGESGAGLLVNPHAQEAETTVVAA